MTESTRDLVSDKVKTKMNDILKIHGYNNIYGYVTAGGNLSEQAYVCYAYFNGRDSGTLALYARACYVSDDKVKRDSLWFEYMFDRRNSPWRQLLAHLDFDLVYSSEHPDCISGVIVYTTKVNKYFLFQFLKNLRQPIERHEAVSIFTEGAKDKYTPGVQMDAETERYVHDLFMVSHMFEGGRAGLSVSWGGEHKNFHGRPTKLIAEKKIQDFDKLVDQKTYFSNTSWTDVNLPLYTFGQADDNFEFANEYVKTIKRLVENNQYTIGYFFKNPYVATKDLYQVEDVIKAAEKIIDDLKIRDRVPVTSEVVPINQPSGRREVRKAA